MKKVFLFSLGFLVAFASLFVSCSDKNNDNGGNDNLICQITVSGTDGGSASITNYIGNSISVLIGNSVEVVAVPDNGYQFIGWFLGDSNTFVSYKKNYTFIASNDVTLVAKFGKQCLVSVSSDDYGTAAIKDVEHASMNTIAGTELTVIATPAANYDFLGWFVGDSEEPVSTEATYRFTVNESVALVAKFERRKTIKDGHEYVDLGLPSGIKWAAYNVGATKPEEYGGYYAWGETEEKSNYSWSTYKWCKGSSDTMTKYCTNSSYGTVDNKTVLDPEDDVVHVKWGGDWRMPTKAEQDELRNNCTWTWTTQNGVNGYSVTGPNGNSIFLPATGYRLGADVNDRGNYGYYWSSSLGSSSSGNAYNLDFSGSNYVWNYSSRCYGQSVRPVSK